MFEIIRGHHCGSSTQAPEEWGGASTLMPRLAYLQFFLVVHIHPVTSWRVRTSGESVQHMAHSTAANDVSGAFGQPTSHGTPSL